jgi:hypothetical protein
MNINCNDINSSKSHPFPVISSGIRCLVHCFYDWETPPGQTSKEFIESKALALVFGICFILAGIVFWSAIFQREIMNLLLVFD